MVRFEFPEGATRRQTIALDTWRAVVSEHDRQQVSIGGKSFGGRMASLVADELSVRSLICLGYPFHPPGQPEKLRTEHLAGLRTPALIVQGERDPFGTREDVASYKLSASIRVEWLPGGDHSFKPRAGSGATNQGNLSSAIAHICSFLGQMA